MTICGSGQFCEQVGVLGSGTLILVQGMENVRQTLAVLPCCLPERTEMLQPASRFGHGLLCIRCFGDGPEELRVLGLQSKCSSEGLVSLRIASGFMVQIPLLLIGLNLLFGW